MRKFFLFISVFMVSVAISAQEVRSVRPSAQKEVKQSVRKNAERSVNINNRDFVKGYHGFIDFGGGFAAGPNGSPLVSMSTSHGYQFNPYYYLGVGVGYNYHAFILGNSIPLFANFRTNLLTTSISPFIDFKIGYSLGKNKGFCMHPAIGGSFLTSRKFGWNISVGYDMQLTQIRYINWPNLNLSPYKENVVIGGITIKAGVEF